MSHHPRNWARQLPVVPLAMESWQLAKIWAELEYRERLMATLHNAGYQTLRGVNAMESRTSVALDTWQTASPATRRAWIRLQAELDRQISSPKVTNSGIPGGQRDETPAAPCYPRLPAPRKKYRDRREFLAEYFELDVSEDPVGCGWLPRVMVRKAGYFGPVEGWYREQGERWGAVKPWRGKVVRGRVVNWRGPAKVGSPVWGWRARVVAWWTLARGVPGVTMGRYGSVLGWKVQEELSRIARGKAPWGVGVHGRVGEAVAAARLDTRWVARPRGAVKFRIGPGGVRLG